MKETVLKSIMRLFAIVSQVHSVEDIEIARRIVNDYLNYHLRSDKIRQFLIMYDFYHSSLREREIKKGDKQLALFSVKSVIICDQVNQFLNKKQKILVIAYIIQILSSTRHKHIDEIDFVKTIALALKIDELVFHDSMSFILGKEGDINKKSNVLIVNRDGAPNEYRYLLRDLPRGSLSFLYIENVDICLLRLEEYNDKLFLNDVEIETGRTYIFEAGSVVRNHLSNILYFSDVIKVFLHDDTEKKIYFVAENLSYHFPNSNIAIEPFNFNEEAGQLIGIMGNSGVGKSTLINILNGNLKPSNGKVLLNGYNIHTNKKAIEGLIGYVPQDDVLIEELTVFENLYLNAQLCFKNLSKDKIVRRVSRLLYTLGLYEVKELKVGNYLNNLVSGGQRKRLNIAMELIREPHILFVDEPTSGLSSNDSNLVIDLLKNQSYKGKLVILNIHQPSNDTFKKLDKLIILDRGGKIIFQGNPIDSIKYLRSYNQLVNAEEGECPNCGVINPDQVLNIIEARRVNEFGEYTSERLVSPEEWHENFNKKLNKETNQASELKLDLPASYFQPPANWAQFKVFSLRNLLSKLADKQYIFINLLEAPALAFILGWFSRYNAGNELDSNAYVFSENINMPAFIFMSVVVSLFIGLMVSAQEIIRDKRIINREAFLHLSRKTYYNSKVVYLAGLLAVQIFLFVIISHVLLEIKGMVFYYWLMLWITSMVAAIVGLNMSAVMRTVVSIYIAIPILLVPQILLGGALIKFDKLNSKATNPRYVPLVGDIIPSRWAYEGLAVFQFSKNRYQKQLFEFDKAVSDNSYMLNYFIPQLNDILLDINRNISDESVPEYIVQQKVTMLLDAIETQIPQIPHCKRLLGQVNRKVFNVTTSSVLEHYLMCCREYYIQSLEHSIELRDDKITKLATKLGSNNNLVTLRSNYFNESLARLVLNKDDADKIEVKSGYIVQKVDPIYNTPKMAFGRSHFYASEKRFGQFYFQTYWFNLAVLGIFFILFYLLLLFEIPQKIHTIANRKTVEWFWLTSRRRLKNILVPIFTKSS